MTGDQAEQLAQAILAGIADVDAAPLDSDPSTECRAADREQVASDLAGLFWCDTYDGPAELRVLFEDGLRRTASRYPDVQVPW